MQSVTSSSGYGDGSGLGGGAGFGDKAGEHLRMARGSYSPLPHVVFGFFIVTVGTWLPLLLAGFVVLERRTVPAPVMAGDDPLLPLLLPESASKRFVLSAWLRHREAKKLGLSTSIRATVAIRKDGEGVVRHLELQLVPRGGTGHDLGPSRPVTVAYGHMPPMHPGEQRVVRFDHSVPGEVLEERLLVTSIE